MDQDQSSTPHAQTNPGPPPVPRRESSFFYVDLKDSKMMLARDGAEFPDVCLITGAETGPDDWRKRCVMAWSPPWVFLGLFFGVIPLLVLVLVTQKKMHMTYSLSREEYKRMNRKQWTGTLMAVFAVFMILVSAIAHSLLFLLIAIGLLIGGIVLGITANPIKVARCEKEWFRIKGVSPAFLETLEQR